MLGILARQLCTHDESERMVIFRGIVACYRRMSACEDCTIPTLRQMAIKFCRTILVIKSGSRGSNFIVYTNKNYESSEMESLRVLKDPQDRVILKEPLFFKIKLAGISTSLHT